MLVCFFSKIVYGQYTDDLKKKTLEVKEASYTDSIRLFDIGNKVIELGKQTKQESVEAEVHIYYGNHYFYKLDLLPAEKHYLIAKKIAESTGRKDLKLLAEIRLSFLKFEKGNMLIAEDELKELLIEAQTQKDYTNVVEIYNLLGIISETNNDTKEAVKYYLEGLTTSELHNLTYFPAVFRNNLALIKWTAGQDKEALIDFEKALAIGEKEKNSRLCSHIQMNLCMIKVTHNNPEQAMKLFAKVIDYSKKNNLPRELASNYLNLSSAFSNAGRNEEAMRYIDSAIYILQKQGLKEELTKALLTKVNLTIEKKNLKEAKTILSTIEDLTKETHKLEDIASFHLMKYRVLDTEKKFEEALKEHLAYTKIKDSLNEQVNGKVIQVLQQSYDVQKKEVELERERSKSMLLEESNQKEKILKWIAIGTGLVVIIILALLLNNWYVRRLRKKQQAFSNKLIENIDNERKRIAFDLHDDIGQSLSIIKSRIVQKQHTEAKNLPEIEQALSTVIEQTREISKKLFPANIEKIGFIRSIALLVENVQHSTQLVCSFDISESIESLPLEQKTHLFRIIQECTNNTIKHSGASGLKIEILEKNKEFQFIYQDNGKGLSAKLSDDGIGLRSLKERAKILNGTLEFIDEKNSKGFKLIIKFKPTKV